MIKVVKMRKKIIAGNWKMNLSFEEGKQLAEELVNRLHRKKEVEVVLIPSFIHLAAIQRISSGYGIKLGAQNVAEYENGAYTGEISSTMLQSMNLNYCLVGHSERRIHFHEQDNGLLKKIKLLLAVGIRPIFCCGENLEDREQGRQFEVVEKQLAPLRELSDKEFSKMVIAYEPVWAIGSGKTASQEQAQEMHAYIRNTIAQHFSTPISELTSILYGGSVKADNAANLFQQQDVDGGLVGGASLKTDEFVAIVNAL